jgi:hypothetical protein
LKSINILTPLSSTNSSSSPFSSVKAMENLNQQTSKHTLFHHLICNMHQFSRNITFTPRNSQLKIKHANYPSVNTFQTTNSTNSVTKITKFISKITNFILHTIIINNKSS